MRRMEVRWVPVLLSLLVAQVRCMFEVTLLPQAVAQGKTMARRKGEDSCPFLDGVYVSVMRRWDENSLHHSPSRSFFPCPQPPVLFHPSTRHPQDHQPRLPQAAAVGGGADADHHPAPGQVTQPPDRLHLAHPPHLASPNTRCTLLVEETIPRGGYVDPDEMRELRWLINFHPTTQRWPTTSTTTTPPQFPRTHTPGPAQA